MRIILIILFIGLTNICQAQKNFEFVKIKEYNFYRLDYNDSFKINYYQSGALKYEQNEKYEIWYTYIDSTKNDSLFSSILTLPRFSYNNCRDSTREIYKYQNGKLSEIHYYEKKCYRENAGCIRYDNTNAGKWHLLFKQSFKVNEQNDYITQTFITDYNNSFDTTIFTCDYTYDSKSRKTMAISYENGNLKSKVVYKYLDSIRREEFYYPEDSTARIITDYKYSNGQLVEKHCDRKYDNTTDTEKYLYIKPNRLYSIEFVSDETNLYKVRKYYYE